ncbi:MAG: hypothetical protein IPG63_13730 [Xanthomonadales bacterium]|nr:hypothetical protein [Xanthomonadales bacterium]
MSVSATGIIPALEGLSRKERLRLAEAVLQDAGFRSLLPSAHPLESALPEAEARALAAVGMRTTLRTRQAAANARGRYAATFLDLFQKADTPAELAETLGLDPSRIRQRIREGTLLAVELNGEKRVPQFQFERGVEVPGLPKVLATVGDKVSPLAFAMWFLTPTPDLRSGAGGGAVSPRDWLLRTGDVDPVLALAEGL